MESCDDDMDSKEMQESRDDDSCHADSGLLSMLAEVASATLHNDSLARKTRGNARGRPRKQTAEGRLDPDQPEPTDANKLSLGQLELLTEKQLVDLFSLMDSDEIRRTFSYSCHLLQRCQYTSSSFGSEMKARQEMQKHLSEHVRDLMRKARDSAGFRFTATPVAPSKAKKITAVVKEVSPVRKPVNNVKEKGTVKIKLQSPRANSKASPSATKAGRAPVAKKNQQQSPRKSAVVPKEDPVVIVKTPTKRKRRSAVAVEASGEDPAMAGLELVPEEITVKDKWMKLYHDKYRAVDEARFRERTDLSADNSEADQDFGTVAEEVVVTSEETFAAASVSLPPMVDAPSLPDHDYNIYRVNRKAKAAAKAAAEAVGLDVQGRRNLDEQMEAVAQSVAAAAQEKEKLKRKRGGTIQNQQQGMGVPLHSFMLEETTKQSKVVVKNKPTEPLPCVGSEVVVGYNPSEFYLMKSSELPVIEDLRQQKTTVGASGTVVIDGQPQFTFVCMNDDGELIEESAIEDSMFLEEDEEQLLEQVAAQATGRSRSLGDVPDKEMVDIARKRAKVKPKFVSQSAGERELALQYIGELKQQRGSGADSLHCKICTPVRTFTAPTTLLSHYRSHAGIKPYECRRCGAVFTRQHSLNYHMLIHANLSRFTCPDCHRQFRHPSHYKEHRRRHTGEAPYECSDCMQRFRTRNSYKRHLMTRHGKLLTSTGGLIILPEEEFNKVRCKPRPVRATGGGARNSIDVSGLANDDDTEFVVPDAVVASTSSNMTAKKSTPKKAAPKRGAKKAAAAAKVKTEEEDGSGNFEQQRQEDLIRLLYQRLTSADGGEEEESGVESGSPIPADGVVESMEIQDENGEIQVMEVNCIEETVVVESQDDVAAAVVVESIPNSVEQVVEEQCEVVAEENWGNYVHLTVDGQNNVIFLDDGQVVGATAEETTTLMIEEAPKPAARAARQRAPAKAKAVTRRSAAAAAKEASATPSQGSSSTATTTNSGEVDLLSFVQSAGVMVQHILDIQSENS